MAASSFLPPSSASAISNYHPLSLSLRLQSNFTPPTPLKTTPFKPLSSTCFQTNNPSNFPSSAGKSPDTNSGSTQSASGATLLFPSGGSKPWLVRIDRPSIGVVTKAQMVDFYVETLTKVLGNEKDAQMCIYHVSWQSNFGFCCELDEESARELAGVPGVISVQPDHNFGSMNKHYRGAGSLNSTKSVDPPDAGETDQINPKKLFIIGLSFYTSEKTLRAAFEPFGELVEVNVIMDKISKRSKGYAFVEYTTKEAASAALQEMNGKIINGWMIVVDMAKNKPRYGRRPKLER